MNFLNTGLSHKIIGLWIKDISRPYTNLHGSKLGSLIGISSISSIWPKILDFLLGFGSKYLCVSTNMHINNIYIGDVFELVDDDDGLATCEDLCVKVVPMNPPINENLS